MPKKVFDKTDKTDKTEKIKKIEKTEKIEKIDKIDKIDKIEKIEKKDICSSDSNSDSECDKSLNDTKKEIVTVLPKRRGRPKKIIEKKPSSKILNKKQQANICEDELILHIPLYDENDSSSEKNIFTMKDDSDSSTKIKTLTHSDDKLDGSDKSDFSVKKLLSELKKKDLIIKKLKACLTKTELNDVVSIMPTESKIKKINLNLIDNRDGKPMVVEKTNISCWWCTYNFDSFPCFIPDRYYSGKFYVFGCFCTYSCAMAYNLEMNDYRMVLRNTLIKEMYTKVTGQIDTIPIAPKRELLKKFGGILSIEEFRNKFLLMKKEFKVKFPPSVPLLLCVEEIESDISTKKSLLQIK
jgi:hypothetical protein